jgi:hypothetical protein
MQAAVAVTRNGFLPENPQIQITFGFFALAVYSARAIYLSVRYLTEVPDGRNTGFHAE